MIFLYLNLNTNVPKKQNETDFKCQGKNKYQLKHVRTI